MHWWQRCYIHTERFLLYKQHTQPARAICLETANKNSHRWCKRTSGWTAGIPQGPHMNLISPYFCLKLLFHDIYHTYLRSPLCVFDVFKQRSIFIHIMFWHFVGMLFCSKKYCPIVCRLHAEHPPRKEFLTGNLNVRRGWIYPEDNTINLLSQSHRRV